MNRNNRNNENNNGAFWTTGAVIGGIAALSGGIYMYLRSKPSEVLNTPVQSDRPSQMQAPNSNSWLSSFGNLLNRLSTRNNIEEDMVSASNIPRNPVITNLNSLLEDIYVRFIQLKRDDFELHYNVFDKIFQKLHISMKQVDPYYNKYSSTVQFAGSHYDNLRIKKPDEFDMDIIIGLPLNIYPNPLNPNGSDIIIEGKHAGYVQLKMGTQYQRLPMRDGMEWLINKTAYEWKGESNYLQQDKFLNWFKSVVNKALNTFDMASGYPLYEVNGVRYVIKKSESGPAMTLIIENTSRGFKLDVDLVPALKFPETRWPINRSYRSIPAGCSKDMFMVVGKPNKAAQNILDVKRSWRIALHNQERELMHGSYNLRQALRLIKKLRDAQEMKKIASYYVKTLFFWEVVERNNSQFWMENNPATLFKIMVNKLYAALMIGEIPYFWNKNNNLIGNVDKATLRAYALKLEPLIAVLCQRENYKHVAKYLLTPQEFMEYNARYLHI